MSDSLDLDALEAAEAKVSPAPWKSHYDGAIYRAATRGGSVVFADGNRDDAAFLVALRNAAPALIAMARKRDADVRYVLERQIGADALADENGRAATAAYAEIARLREALEAAEAATPSPRSAPR